MKEILDSKIARMVFVVVLVIGLYFSLKTCWHRGAVISDTKEVIKLQHDTVDTYKDAYNQEHSRVVSLEVALENVSRTSRISIDSLSEALQVAKKNITSVSSIDTKSTASVKPTVNEVKTDSGHLAYDFTYSDKWANISGHIRKDTSLLTYDFTDHIITSSYAKREWFLGAKKLYFDAYSENPHTKIFGLENITRPIKIPSRLGIGPYIGISYMGGKWQPSYGFSLHYSILRL